MVSCSDDVRHMTDESSTTIHRGRRVVCRGPNRANLQPQLQGNTPLPQPPVEPTYESLPLASSNEMKGTPKGLLWRNCLVKMRNHLQIYAILDLFS
ncbi:unnamed protein product [Protopolystoma xenopodis]|uniref:Uncharacterized protein n=1 Tax=Protopolystoma xenopodis TaxID=117903 RepID=A0A3S5AI17_9PLAT|nr:unnamed protein product [Protopolystoma xenopodis]